MDFKKVVVAGGGVLGSQIAYQSSYCGFDVTIWLRSEGSVERAKEKLERLRDIYVDSLEKWKTDETAYCPGFSKDKDLSAEEIDELKERAVKAYENLTLTTSYEEAADDADFVIEAIAEDPDQKIAFYEELRDYLPEKTVLVTNSSTLLPSLFAEHSGRPEKYLAFHFANNIWALNMAEVMGHAGTDQKYYDMVVEYAEAINMEPIKVLKEQPAYILNSLLVPISRAALCLWADEVGDPENIDKTWRLGTGAFYGPLQFLDIVGLVTVYNIFLMDPEAEDPDSLISKVLTKLKEKIDAGETGVIAGKGFYEY